jgi:UTP--glucose-1-phosphate uridylyltransferase
MDSPKPVTKAVIPAAGFGTRFLPQTKAMPKEMLPLVDKPIIQYVVEELVDAGIKDIIIVTGYHKRSIEDHFDILSADLRQNLKAGGKTDLLEQVKKISDLANFIYIRQKGPYGNATPILNAAHLIGDEPFIYTWSDDFIMAQPSSFKQMIDKYNQLGSSVISCIKVTNDEDYSRYGFIGGEPAGPGLIKMRTIVEKPGKEAAPSDLASVSGYLFIPKMISFIEQIQADLKDGEEFIMQPAMQKAIEQGEPIYACEIADGKFYDTGNKLEYLKTVVDFGLKNDELGADFKAYLRDLQL